MKLSFINPARMFLGLLAELACIVKPLDRKYQVSRRLRGPWPKGPFLWMHGASMGECKMLLKLADALRKDIPDLPRILITTQKPEVARHLQSSLMQDAAGQACGKPEVALAPADVPWVMKKFLRRTRPVGLVLGENELWPGYLSDIKSFTRRPAVALVSGRFKKAVPGMDFSGLGFAAMQTSADRKNFLKFSSGSFRAPICEGGNWKLLSWARDSLTADSQNLESNPAVRSAVSFVSVHAEEIPALKPLLRSALCQGKPVVLVPRRLEEVPQFRNALNAMNVKVQDWPQLASGSVSLVNCFGAVSEILGLSESAVVGGSFHKSLGIHDFWEPLQQGVSTYIGPYTCGHEYAIDPLVRQGVLVQLNKSQDFNCGKPIEREEVCRFLAKEREKILNSYGQLKKFVEELLK